MKLVSIFHCMCMLFSRLNAKIPKKRYSTIVELEFFLKKIQSILGSCTKYLRAIAYHIFYTILTAKYLLSFSLEQYT